MGDPSSAGSRFNASKDALKVIYYVVVGFAITASLDRTILADSGAFVGGAVLRKDNLPTVLLLLAFLPSVSDRFDAEAVGDHDQPAPAEADDRAAPGHWEGTSSSASIVRRSGHS